MNYSTKMRRGKGEARIAPNQFRFTKSPQRIHPPNPPATNEHARTTELMLGFEPQQINYNLRSIDHVFRPTCFTYGDARSGAPLSYIRYLKPCLTAHPQIPSGFQREGASRDELRYAYPVKIQG